MNELALFAGAGGGILGTRLPGWRVVCAVEIEPYCREVVLRRQEEGILEAFPIWDDVRTFDGKPWRGIVDVVTGGFPCQPFSVAGKRKGAMDERNLWPDTLRIIREVRPRWCLLENVPGLLHSGYFGTILGGLAESGYDARWKVISAGELGAPHRRDRLWIVADCQSVSGRLSGKDIAERPGWQERDEFGQNNSFAADVADAEGQQNDKRESGSLAGASEQGGCVYPTIGPGRRITWWGADPADAGDAECDGRHGEPKRGGVDAGETEGGMCEPEGSVPGFVIPGLGRMADGLPDRLDGSCPPVAGPIPRVATGVCNRVDRLKALGNAQVPLCAAIAWRLLSEPEDE